MGKSIDKRIGELGGRRIVDLHCADEPTNLEEVVESWKLKIAIALKELAGSLSSASAVSSVLSESLAESTEKNDMDRLNINSNSNSLSTVLPGGVKSAGDVWALLGLQGDSSAPPIAKLLPGGAATSVPDSIEILESINSSGANNLTDKDKANAKTESFPNCEWTVERPFSANVVSARYLTQGSVFEDRGSQTRVWGEEKKVIEVIISLNGSGITYEPGDSVAVCCPNPDPLVDMVLVRLNAGLTAGVPLNRETLVRRRNCEACTLGEILSFK